MSFSKRSTRWGRVPRFEALVSLFAGGVVALFVEPSLGATVWAIGAIITLTETRHEAKLDERLERVDRLAAAFDLSHTSNVSEIQNLISNYLAVAEPELARIKDAVVAGARDDLLRLATDKSSGELPSGEYYSWLLPMLERVPSGGSIRALSMMMDCEWDSSEPERRFIQANIDAANRGVVVQRVFVAPASVMLRAIEEVPAISPQLTWKDPPKLTGYFVDCSYLGSHDPKLLDKLGDGFIDLDGRVALVDLHSVDGSARGEVTMLQARLGQLHDIHSQLLLHARPLDTSLVEELKGSVDPNRH